MLPLLAVRLTTSAVLLLVAPAHTPSRGAPLDGAPWSAQDAAPIRHATPDSAVEFRLKDQFGQVHDAADYRGRPVYLVGAGRGGRASATAWAAALGPLVRGADGNAGAVVPVADLQGVPRLLRGFVRGRFPSARGSAVLLDWDGAVSRRLGFDPAQSTVLVLAPSGRPVLRANTLGVDTAAAAAFVRRARAAVDGGGAAGPPTPLGR